MALDPSAFAGGMGNSPGAAAMPPGGAAPMMPPPPPPKRRKGMGKVKRKKTPQARKRSRG